MRRRACDAAFAHSVSCLPRFTIHGFRWDRCHGSSPRALLSLNNCYQDKIIVVLRRNNWGIWWTSGTRRTIWWDRRHHFSYQQQVCPCVHIPHLLLPLLTMKPISRPMHQLRPERALPMERGGVRGRGTCAAAHRAWRRSDDVLHPRAQGSSDTPCSRHACATPTDSGVPASSACVQRPPAHTATNSDTCIWAWACDRATRDDTLH